MHLLRAVRRELPRGRNPTAGGARMRTPVYAIIDLFTRTSARYEIDASMYKKYIGGKMLGARLLYDLTPAGVDPLGADAVVIINTSPANGTGAPCSSRFNMTFK